MGMGDQAFIHTSFCIFRRSFEIFGEIFVAQPPRRPCEENTEFGRDSDAGVNIQPIFVGLEAGWQA